jgi:hypothetical protein
MSFVSVPIAIAISCVVVSIHVPSYDAAKSQA